MARNADIRLRRSAISGNVPTVEQLNLGELAVNTADGKLFLKRSFEGIEQIVEIGGNDARSGLVSTFNNYIYTSDGTLQTINGPDDYGHTLSYDLASPRRIQLFLNGVLLHQGIDFDANDGATIELMYPVAAGQVVQISAYNSDGASIDADLILDDGFAFVVGTNEETKFYHNGTNTILKHLAYGDNTFNMMWRDSDRLIMGENGVAIIGNLTINGNQVVTDSDVVSLINSIVDTQYVENLDLTAGAISYQSSPTGVNASNVQEAIDLLQDTKLDVTAITSNVSLYPTTVDVGGSYKLVTSLDDVDYNTTAVDVNTGVLAGTDVLIARLVSEPGILEGSTGSINIHTIGNVRVHAADGTGEATFHFEVYKLDSQGVETLLATSTETLVVSSTTYSQFSAYALIDSTTFTLQDSVVLKYYGTATTSNHTSYDFQFGGSLPIRTNFPVPISVIPESAKHAHDINVDTSAFTGVLSGSDTHVQQALNTIDALTRNDFIPEVHNTYSLGSLSSAWKDVFVGPGSLYINGCRILGEDSSMNITMTTDPNQDLILRPGQGGNLIFAVDSGQSIQFSSPVNLTTADVAEHPDYMYLTAARVREAISASGGIVYDQTTGIIAIDTNVIPSKTYLESYVELYADSQDALTLTAAKLYSDNLNSDQGTFINSIVQSTDSANRVYTSSLVLSTDSDNKVFTSALVQSTDSDNKVYTNQLVTSSAATLTTYIDSAVASSTLASSAYTDSAISIAISSLIDNAPGVLDTLNEIAAALGNDSDFVGTVQTWINQKLDKTATTDDVTEGSTNKYFTTTRARQSVTSVNGIVYDESTGTFALDSSVSFNSVTATTFNGSLNGTASNATNADDADKLDGQHGSYYRINIYDVAGNLVN